MSGKKQDRFTASATPWDDASDTSLSPAQTIVKASQKSAYEYRHCSFDYDIDFFNSYTRNSCPICDSEDVRAFGHEKSGMQRYRCNSCQKTFTPVTGTIFEARKLPVSAWVEFLMQAFSYESIATITREDRRSETTIPYWFGKVFAVLEGVQDDVILTGKVQIDEAYYHISDTHIAADDAKNPHLLNQNKICIAVGCDDHKHSYFASEGLGKTSGAKTMAAFSGHIEQGSHLIHDMEKSHHKLIHELRLEDEVYNSKHISTVFEKDDPLRNVHHLCSLLRLLLGSHPEFMKGDLEGYLNLFSVMMNPPENKMEKVAFVLNRAMDNPKTLRYRDFYHVNTSSEA